MPIKFATGWVASLTDDLSATATVLPLSLSSRQRFSELVGASEADGHTFIVLSNGAASEVVRAYTHNGVVRIERASPSIVVPTGSCVRFEVTQQLLDGYTIPENTITEIVGENGINVVQSGSVVTVSLPECDGASWTIGNRTYNFEEGCVVATPASPGSGCVLAPGVYKNATITVSAGGEICSIVQGSNIVFSNDPCCTNCED